MTIDPIIITGMHRSGTTMITNFLAQAGIFFGIKKEKNGESIFFQRINEWLFKEANASWDNPDNFQFINQTYKKEVLRVIDLQFRNFFAKVRFLGLKKSFKYRSIKDLNFLWGWKDPRNTFTVDIWLDIFPKAKIIHIFRNPIDVASSLAKRESEERKLTESGERRIIINRFKEYFLTGKVPYQKSVRVENLEEGINLWEKYVKKALSLNETAGKNMIHIKYESFLEKPDFEMKKLFNFLNLKFSETNIDGLCQGINSSRKFAFLKDADLVNLYNKYKNNELMKVLGYENLI